MDMYDITGADPNVEINGFPFYATEIKANEGLNRRELTRKKIKMGTEFVARGEYIPREYSFTTTIEIPEERPDIHNEVFLDIMNSPAEVVCPDMGGIFKAQVIIKQSHETGNPTQLDLEVTVKEIPEKSLIPNDTVESLSIDVLKTQEEANEEAKAKNSSTTTSKTGG